MRRVVFGLRAEARVALAGVAFRRVAVLVAAMWPSMMTLPKQQHHGMNHTRRSRNKKPARIAPAGHSFTVFTVVNPPSRTSGDGDQGKRIRMLLRVNALSAGRWSGQECLWENRSRKSNSQVALHSQDWSVFNALIVRTALLRRVPSRGSANFRGGCNASRPAAAAGSTMRR